MTYQGQFYIYKEVKLDKIVMQVKIEKKNINVSYTKKAAVAEKSANSTCPFIHGQPEMPNSVKALKKRHD